MISNGGGWQSNDLDLATPELAELFAEVRKRLDEVHRAFELNVRIHAPGDHGGLDQHQSEGALQLFP